MSENNAPNTTSEKPKSDGANKMVFFLFAPLVIVIVLTVLFGK